MNGFGAEPSGSGAPSTTKVVELRSFETSAIAPWGLLSIDRRTPMATPVSVVTASPTSRLDVPPVESDARAASTLQRAASKTCSPESTDDVGSDCVVGPLSGVSEGDVLRQPESPSSNAATRTWLGFGIRRGI